MAWHNIDVLSHAYYDTFQHINTLRKSRYVEGKEGARGDFVFGRCKSPRPPRGGGLTSGFFHGGSSRGIVENYIEVYLNFEYIVGLGINNYRKYRLKST